jgi:hypothetical protein
MKSDRRATPQPQPCRFSPANWLHPLRVPGWRLLPNRDKLRDEAGSLGRNYYSAATYEKSVAPHRERLRKKLA